MFPTQDRQPCNREHPRWPRRLSAASHVSVNPKTASGASPEHPSTLLPWSPIPLNPLRRQCKNGILCVCVCVDQFCARIVDFSLIGVVSIPLLIKYLKIRAAYFEHLPCQISTELHHLRTICCKFPPPKPIKISPPSTYDVTTRSGVSLLCANPAGNNILLRRLSAPKAPERCRDSGGDLLDGQQDALDGLPARQNGSPIDCNSGNAPLMHIHTLASGCDVMCDGDEHPSGRRDREGTSIWLSYAGDLRHDAIHCHCHCHCAAEINYSLHNVSISSNASSWAQLWRSPVILGK